MMCYTVLVITDICTEGHPESGRICWRQCREQASHSRKHNQWNTRCLDHQSDVLIPIADKQRRVVHTSLCRTCQNLLRIVTHSDAASKLMQEQDRKEIFRQLVVELSEQNKEFRYSDDEEDLQLVRENTERMEKLQEEIDKCVDNCDVLNTTLHCANNDIEAEGLKFVKDEAVSRSEDAKVQLLFYYGRQDCAEEKVARRVQDDWPMNFPDIDTDILTFSIVRAGVEVFNQKDGLRSGEVVFPI